jgi:hypothetical protein
MCSSPITSETANRPPGRSTRAASRITRDLSAARLITQLEIFRDRGDPHRVVARDVGIHDRLAAALASSALDRGCELQIDDLSTEVMFVNGYSAPLRAGLVGGRGGEPDGARSVRLSSQRRAVADEPVEQAADGRHTATSARVHPRKRHIDWELPDPQTSSRSTTPSRAEAAQQQGGGREPQSLRARKQRPGQLYTRLARGVAIARRAGMWNLPLSKEFEPPSASAGGVSSMRPSAPTISTDHSHEWALSASTPSAVEQDGSAGRRCPFRAWVLHEPANRS